MALKIRTPIDSWSNQQVTLDNTNLILELLWNTRNESWVISLFDLDENPILTGIKLTENVSVTARYTDSRLPSGNIWCARLNPKAPKITRDNLGTDFILVYLTEEEEQGNVTV